MWSKEYHQEGVRPFTRLGCSIPFVFLSPFERCGRMLISSFIRSFVGNSLLIGDDSPCSVPALEELGLVLDPPTTQEITYANSLTIANQGFRTRSTPALAASRGASRGSHSRSVSVYLLRHSTQLLSWFQASPEASGPFHSPRRSSRTHGETNKTRSSFLVLLFASVFFSHPRS